LHVSLEFAVPTCNLYLFVNSSRRVNIFFLPLAWISEYYYETGFITPYFRRCRPELTWRHQSAFSVSHTGQHTREGPCLCKSWQLFCYIYIFSSYYSEGYRKNLNNMSFLNYCYKLFSFWLQKGLQKFTPPTWSPTLLYILEDPAS
jgi:hypothetical protein